MRPQNIYWVVILLSGCASSPYAEVGIGYQLDSNSDWFVRTERDWQCDNPQFHGELGLEWENNWKLGYHHQSWIGCGKPFNHKPELYMDDIRLTKKWGGK